MPETAAQKAARAASNRDALLRLQADKIQRGARQDAELRLARTSDHELVRDARETLQRIKNDQKHEAGNLYAQAHELRDHARHMLDFAVRGAAEARKANPVDGDNAARLARAAEAARVFRDLPEPGLFVKSEPATYRRDNAREVSYFHDLHLATGGDGAALEARGRLERHDREVRVNPNRTPGQGGYGAPPLWLIEEYATVPRASRVLAKLIGSLPLSRGVSSINLPRLTTGTKVAATLDGAATASADITDTFCTSPAMPVIGHEDVPLAMLEQSPAKDAALDVVLFTDLEAAYDEMLEAYALAGSGTHGQILGLASIDIGSNDVVYADASPTAAELIPYLSKAAGRLGRARKQPMECWLMTSARWSWISSAGLAASIVSSVPGDDGRAGHILGKPVFEHNGLAETLGPSGQEDIIMALRPSDLRLWESSVQVKIDRESLSGTLSVRLILHRYAAAILDRYASGIAAITGTGLILGAEK